MAYISVSGVCIACASVSSGAYDMCQCKWGYVRYVSV